MNAIEQIKQHALDNYNNGWDYIVECYTDEEIQQEYLDVAGGDVTKAMALIQEVADYRNEQYGEARRAVEENADTEEGTPMIEQVNTTAVADLIAELLDANWDFNYACQKQRESKDAGMSYLEELYREDRETSWDRMHAAEQALEGLGIDVREAQRKLDAQRKAA